MTEPTVRDMAISKASHAIPEQRGEAAKALALLYLADALNNATATLAPLVDAAKQYLWRH